MRSGCRWMPCMRAELGDLRRLGNRLLTPEKPVLCRSAEEVPLSLRACPMVASVVTSSRRRSRPRSVHQSSLVSQSFFRDGTVEPPSALPVENLRTLPSVHQLTNPHQ